MIARLELNDFSAFSEFEIDFSPRINVIIGENGTGKTQLLKAAYCLCKGRQVQAPSAAEDLETLEDAVTAKLLRLFKPISGKLGSLRRYGGTESARLSATFSPAGSIEATFHANSQRVSIQTTPGYSSEQDEPIFVPTKEVLSLVEGISHPSHDQQTVDRIFDDSYTDLAELLLRPAQGDPAVDRDADPRIATVIPQLVELIGGRYLWEDGQFCFETGRYEERKNPDHSRAVHAQFYQDSSMTQFVPANEDRYAGNMTAEGFRKIGLLHRLLLNKSLQPGINGPLFWDEPESNLNPRLMKMLVQCLLDLSRNGQQVILASHDYVLLKWLDLLVDEKGKEDHVRFHILWRNAETRKVCRRSVDSYQQIGQSAISDTFAELYDEDLKRALG